MIATSVRGSMALICFSSSTPDCVGKLQVRQNQIGSIGFQSRQRRFRALRFRAGESQCSSDGHAQACGCSAHHPPPVIEFSDRRSWFPEGFLHNRHQLLYTKRLLDARRPALRQQRLRLAVRRVTADQNDAGTQVPAGFSGSRRAPLRHLPLPAFECRRSRPHIVPRQDASVLPRRKRHSPPSILAVPALPAGKQSPTARPQSAESGRPFTWPIARSSASLFRGRAARDGFGSATGIRTTNVLPAFVGIVPALNLAAMRAHNPVANAQAQSRAFAGCFVV